MREVGDERPVRSAGPSTTMALATKETDMELRREAVQRLGLMGTKTALTLSGIYKKRTRPRREGCSSAPCVLRAGQRRRARRHRTPGAGLDAEEEAVHMFPHALEGSDGLGCWEAAEGHLTRVAGVYARS